MKKENSYKGHRNHIKKQFLKIDLDNFVSQTVLEYLLFFAIPRKDTNELGYRLLKNFGTLSQVFDAPYEELLKIEGIGENAALLIKSIPSLARLYHIDKSKLDGRCIVEKREAERILLPMFVGKSKENFAVLFMDSRNVSLGASILFEGSVNRINFNYRLLVESIIKYNATKIYIAHNHPGGFARPSQDDINITGRIYEILKSMEVELVDHFIVADDDDHISLKDTKHLDKIKRVIDQKIVEMNNVLKGGLI